MKTELFWHHNKRDFPDRVFLIHKSKMTVDFCVFKFLRRSVGGKYLMRFQSETTVFKFLRHGVDRALHSSIGKVVS